MQFASIDRRSPMPAGTRQVDFTPVETLLCLAASLVVNHRQFGSSSAPRAPEPVPSLARLFRRPNSSILAKMANLDGSRSNGGRYEVEVSSILLASPGRLTLVYRLLLAAARDVGIRSDRLPDFLDLEHDSGDLELYGQEEISDGEIALVIQGDQAKWHARTDVEERVTERLLTASVRVGQHRFASSVMRNHRHRCVFCGLSVRHGERAAPRMLVASHIKPWRVSNSRERLDPSNGLTACPTHDVAFDTGLLTVNGGLRIHVQTSLEQAALHDDATRAAFGRPPLADRLILPAGAERPGNAYLAWHKENVFAAQSG